MYGLDSRIAYIIDKYKEKKCADTFDENGEPVIFIRQRRIFAHGQWHILCCTKAYAQEPRFYYLVCGNILKLDNLAQWRLLYPNEPMFTYYKIILPWAHHNYLLHVRFIIMYMPHFFDDRNIPVDIWTQIKYYL